MRSRRKLRVDKQLGGDRNRRGIIACTVVLLCATAGCTDRAAQSNVDAALQKSENGAQTAPDDFGARIKIDSRVGMRVVSLVPAATEVIFAIGRGERLVGRTTWDTYPDSAKFVANVGDGIRPNVEVVLAKKPTLVVLYAGNDNRSAATAFAKMGIAVLAIKVDHISDFDRLTRQLGLLLDAQLRAQRVVDTVNATLANVRTVVAGAPRPTVVWPLWDAPVLVVGHGSFVSELLDIAGADNVFADMALPSPEVAVEEIAKRNPDFVLSSPVGAQRIRLSDKWRAVRAVRANQIRIVDTTVTGRPTVTLGMAAVSLAKLLHPDRASALP
jgi:iron complex transport system substrate-binding protein